MLFGGGVTEEGRRAAAVSPRTLRRIIYWPRCFARNDYICKNSILLLNYPVKPFYKRNPSFKTLFRHVTSKSGGCLLFVLFWIHRLILDFYKGAVPPSPKRRLWFGDKGCFPVRTLTGTIRLVQQPRTRNARPYTVEVTMIKKTLFPLPSQLPVFLFCLAKRLRNLKTQR